jgi:hypothetical protein
MQMTFTFFALPAIFGLVTKAVMFLYARWTSVHNTQTRLYLATLISLAVYNLFEISLFVNHQDGVMTSAIEYTMRSLATIIYLIVAIVFHLSLVTALPRNSARGNLTKAGIAMVYAPTLILEVLLWCSSLLIVQFIPMSYTYTRVAGPLYFLFEIYTGVYLSAAIALFLYGAYTHPLATRRAQNKLLLIGFSPLVLLGLTIIGLQHFGFRGFNATATVTLALTFFLAFGAYATHQRRLYDIEFFIPWSNTRRRKTAFYDRLRAAIAEIAHIDHVGGMVQRVSDTLQCPIALVSGATPSFAMVGDALSIARFPISELRKIDQMTVAEEIVQTAPATYELMRRYKVAAIVPFHPHSEAAASWMLFGTAFNEQVYSPLDFKVVEVLFARLADRFLDTQLLARYQAEDNRWLRIYHPAPVSSSLDIKSARNAETT